MSDSGNQSSARMLNISFNMILLVFFVYLNTIGENDESKIKKAFGSLVGTFGIIQGGLNIMEGEKLLPKGPPMLDPFKSSVDATAMLRRFIEERQIADEVIISRKQRNLTIDFSNKLLFKSGNAELLEDGRELLGIIAVALKQSSSPLRIEGHTDNIPISTKKYPSNWELSTARAVAVLKFLHEEHHIPAERLLAMGYGEYRPIVPNDTPENRARNRRVRIILEEE